MENQSELSLVAGPNGEAESQRIKGRLRSLLFRNTSMPSGIRKQFMNTLVMTRSPNEWLELEETINEELAHWDEVAEANKRVKQAKAVFRKSGRWPPGYEPNVDSVESRSSWL
jgi:hypothetical protein